MRVLVLTGTTGFGLLESAVLDLAKADPASEFVIQSPNKVVTGSNVEHHRFLDMEALDTSGIDVVVGHCGAGTTFWALERQIPFIGIVDLTRPDKHQRDLGNWLETSGHAMVLFNRGPTAEELERVTTTVFRRYERDPFRFDRIIQKLQELNAANRR
jgi:UDP-N-acetylglucosamine transferase subunit ALG13